MARFRRTKKSIDKLKTGVAQTAGVLVRSHASPDEKLGELFREVQERRVYEDGKTFVDLVPRKRTRAIHREYKLLRQDPDFDLREFVDRHFYEHKPNASRTPYRPDVDTTTSAHISNLWSELERRNRKRHGSLLALPYKYIVPGGRFEEQFYWDSYFIMLGLAADERWGDIEAMMGNYKHVIRRYGYIPTANRTYLASRSQPPYFSHMVELVAQRKGHRQTYLEYLPYLLSEYRFWMRGYSRLDGVKRRQSRRVVMMPDNSYLNRYYDNKSTPRPESQKEDISTAEKRQEDRRQTYLDLRAAAESGWDFSSRWFAKANDITTIETTQIVPIDLNCLLYHLEETITECYRIMHNPILRMRFARRAKLRKKAINQFLWSGSDGFYHDYHLERGEQTEHMTLAAVYPLAVGIASQEQADAVAMRLELDFLREGGLVTTLDDTGEQWDSPNGWAPLQWTAIEGLRRYGHNELADTIQGRWLAVCDKVYAGDRKMIEKYDVTSDSGKGGGGEYPLQDGFGWTNGVYQALAKIDTML